MNQAPEITPLSTPRPRRGLRVLLTALCSVLLAGVVLPVVAGLILQIGAVQNYAVGRLTDWLTQKTGTTFSVRHVQIALFNRAVFEGLYIEDPTTKDTLLYVDRLDAGFRFATLFSDEIILKRVVLFGGTVGLAKDSLGVMNIKRVFDPLKSKKPKTNRAVFRLRADGVELDGVRFMYRVYRPEPKPFGVNFKDLDLRGVAIRVADLRIADDDIRCRIEQIAFREKSGFALNELSARRAIVNGTGLRLERLKLKTDHSSLVFHHLNFFYDRWRAFNNFTSEVEFDAVIEPSSLAYRTIAAFTRRPTEIPTVLSFSGEVRGPVRHLEGFITEAHAGNTELGFQFSIEGLPKIDSAQFHFQLDRLATRGEDIRELYRELTNKPLNGMSDLLERGGEIHFNGHFVGRLKDFVADGRLTTDQGSVLGKLQFLSSAGARTRFKGHLAANDFELGQLLRAAEMGAITAEANVDAEVIGDSMTVQTRAAINRFFYKGYDYNDIRMEGRFLGTLFEGHISCDDPNLTFVTNGRFDVADTVPVYDFEMDLRRADLRALHLNRRDSVSQLSMRFRAHATGSTLDDVNGTAVIDRLDYINHIDTVRTGIVRFEAQNGPDAKRFSMRSDVADLDLRGTNSYENLFRYFTRTLHRYVPSLAGSPPAQPAAHDLFNPGDYLVQLRMKQASNIAAIFVPGLEIAQGSSLTFLFNPERDQFSLSAQSDYIFRQNMYIGSLLVESRNVGDSVSLYASASDFGFGKLDLPNFSLVGGLRGNRIDLAAHFANESNGSDALISTTTTITRTPQGTPRLDVEFSPTPFKYRGRQWSIDRSRVVLDTTGITFHRFALRSDRQHLLIDGRASRSEADILRVELDRVDISALTQLVERQGYRLAGYASGDAQLVAPLGQIQFSAAIRFDSLAVNDLPIGGPVDFHSRWDGRHRHILFGATDWTGDEPIRGLYDSDNKRFDVEFEMPRFDMRHLEPLLTGILSETRGQADVKLKLTGTGKTPTLNGTIRVASYSALVDYTRVRYDLSGLITVRNNRFELLPAVPVYDEQKNQGKISAWFDSQYFKKLRFGVKVDDFKDMLCLNTSSQDNPLFYGHAFGTGSFSVTGDERNTTLDVRAETAGNSTFVMPFSDVSTISDATFIRFVNPDDTLKVESPIEAFRRRWNQVRQRTSSELGINLNLSVLPNTEARIVMNSRYGDEIKGRGTGRFRMTIVPNRDIFTMDGQLTVSEGTYLFTLGGYLVNKFFSIDPGGTLEWRGDPTDPIVNLTAAYRLRTSLKPLIENAGLSSQSSGTATVNCGINLTGKLFQPDIRFDITVPGADPEIQNLVANMINTEEARTTQFIYLMAMGGFMPDAGLASIGTMPGSVAGMAGMEFLSNQISNLLSTDRYNLRLGYRPAMGESSEEITWDFGTDIIANKLSFEVGGNYDIGKNDAYNASGNPLSVDGNLTWTLNKSGSIKVKGFTRTIDSFDESQGLQDNGVGVYFRQEFRDKEDFKERYRKWLEARKQRKAIRQEQREQRRKKSNAP